MRYQDLLIGEWYWSTENEIELQYLGPNTKIPDNYCFVDTQGGMYILSGAKVLTSLTVISSD